MKNDLWNKVELTRIPYHDEREEITRISHIGGLIKLAIVYITIGFCASITMSLIMSF